MVKKEIIFSALLSVFAGIVFFYKFIFFGLLPFPGDLLVAEYKPWSAYGSYPSKAQYPDVLRQLYPWKTEVIEQFKSGHLPLWNPHNFSGTPLLANFQSAALYPLGILYFLLSQPLAWGILVFLQPIFASLFTYWYCRSIKLTPLASTFAAISFSYGSYMNVWLEYNTIGHVILWLPLALLAIEKGWTLILIFALTLPFFAGHPQIAASVYIFSLIYLWIRTRRLGVRVFLPLGIAAIQLIPGIELILSSARNSLAYDFFVNKVLIQPWQLIMLVLPDFFGNPATRTYWPADTYIGKVLSVGLVPLFFLLATGRAKHELKQIFLVTAAVILLFATKNPLTIFLYRIPELRTSSPTLFIFLFQFSLAILTGIGLDWFRREPHTIKKITLRTVQVVIVLALGFGGVWFFKYNPGIRALIYASAIAGATLILLFAAISKKRLMTFVLIALIFVQIADLFYAFHKFNPFIPAKLVYPDTPIAKHLSDLAGNDRIWGYGTAAIEANFATQLGIYSPDGYDPLYPKWYGEFITLSQNSVFEKAIRSDAVIAPGFGPGDLTGNYFRLTILKRLGISYLLDRPENGTVPDEQLKKIYDRDGWIIYELVGFVPKAVLASRYHLAQTQEEFKSRYFDPEFNPTQEVILEERPSSDPLAELGRGLVQKKRYEPGRIDLTVSITSPKLLVISDTYYPGWVARVDGEETPIYRANYTMRAILAPSGNHEVTFSYEPISVRLGIAISIVSLILLSVLLLKYEKR